MQAIRRPAVAGQFYPASPDALRAIVQDFLRRADEKIDAETDGRKPYNIAGLVVPHAGYPYSGPTAAAGYARLAHDGAGPRRVLLIGPAHYVPVQGLAAPTSAAFATPLGDVALDHEALDQLLRLPFVHARDDAHAPEHSLEVHLPFLQMLFARFTLVPLLAGACAPEDIAAALRLFIAPGDLIVVSSDLSHFHESEEARRLDRRTAQRIEALQPLAAADACGRLPINGLLHLARELGWRARAVDLCNSGDTGGPPHRVVGYGAFLLYTPPFPPQAPPLR